MKPKIGLWRIQVIDHLLEKHSKFIRGRKHKLEISQMQYAIKTCQACKEK